MKKFEELGHTNDKNTQIGPHFLDFITTTQYTIRNFLPKSNYLWPCCDFYLGLLSLCIVNEQKLCNFAALC
jgi:hypothetical protein